MNTFQDAVGTFLIQVFMLLPIIVIPLFLLALILFLSAPKGSPKRRTRRIWFIIVTAVCVIALLTWIAVIAYMTYAINNV